MPTAPLPILDFVARNYKNFNARATRDALFSYWDHVNAGGKMYWAVAGAMSSAQLGITLAPAIRAGLIHGLSVTGANLEESLFRLVAHHGYKDCPECRAVEKILVAMWKKVAVKAKLTRTFLSTATSPRPTTPRSSSSACAA